MSKNYKLDPVETPGYCHVGGLTAESADVASRILTANRTAYHVFTTHFDKMGVSSHPVRALSVFCSLTLEDRPTYTTTLPTTS